jgi:hypothetical protein
MESNKLKAESLKRKAFFCAMFCFSLFAFGFQPAKAQTFDEWFNQKKTQIKYLTQQIAALNAFERSVKQGYDIAKNEWASIGSFKNSEFGLHQNYYNSLSQVNPLVKNSVDLTGIQTERRSIISQFNALNNLTGLSAVEQRYIQSVGQNLVAEFDKDMDELQTVLTPGKLVMTDDERIERINKVSASMKDKYVFACAFCTQVKILAAQRNQDSDGNEALQKLYGINP